MAKQIVVTSVSPKPRMVAGVSVAFEGTKSFPLTMFSADQLKTIIADRMLSVVVGEVLDEAGVDAFVKSVPAK